MTSTGTICAQIESYSFCIHGETYMFAVHSASIVPDRPSHTVLQIGVFRRDASGQVLAATMRVTAPVHELDRVPTLLSRALGEWLIATTTPVERVH
jgi:hypothetical protein